MEISLKKHINLESPDDFSIVLENTSTSEDNNFVEETSLNFTRDPQSYLSFQEIPIYEPTAAEFREPIALINKLKEMGYDQFGCVKIKAPLEWNPKFSLTLEDKKITTRKQTLQDLTKGKVIYCDFQNN